MAKLEKDATVYELPENLRWRDEFAAWEPVKQSRDRALDGSIVIQETPLQAGRPITLVGAWAPRSQVLTLRGLAEDPGALTLTLEDGREFDVMWRRDSREPAVDAEPVIPAVVPEAGDLYTLTLRFITV